MPYAPQHRLQTELLYQGLRDAGAGISEGLKRMDANKNKMENLELSARLMAAQHPDLVTPEVLEKFSKGGMGQREALVGQMTAAIADKYRNRQLDQTDQAQQITVAGMNLENERFGRQLAQREREHDDEMAASIPRFMKSPSGGTLMTVPKTGYTQPLSKPTIPAPGGKEQDQVMGPDGKPAYELRWNPYKGEYDRYDLRPRAAAGDPFATGGGSTPGSTGAQPSIPASSSASTGTYRSPADVKAAVRSGTLGKEQASKILREQFGYE